MKLNTCCGCFSLKTGTIFAGVCGIILSIATILALYLANVEWKTIVIDLLPQWIVRIILVINLCMTILISTLLIIGALKKHLFLMIPWIVLGILLAVGLLISVIYTAVMFFINHQVLSGVLWLVLGLLYLIIYVYIWFVVYSYFQEVRYEKTNVKLGPYGRPYNYRRP